MATNELMTIELMNAAMEQDRDHVYPMDDNGQCVSVPANHL